MTADEYFELCNKREKEITEITLKVLDSGDKGYDQDLIDELAGLQKAQRKRWACLGKKREDEPPASGRHR